MLSAHRTIITHDKIIKVMAELGYEGVEKGICNGLAQMWIQAVFCEEIEKFIARLYFICGTPDLLKRIETANGKKGINLSEEDRACIEMLAFFDGVQLYQNFRLYTHLFNKKPHHLDAAAISEITLPIKLEKRPIMEIYSENRLFNSFSLQRFLNELAGEFALYYKNKAMMTLFKQPLPDLVIALHSCTHKVVLRYNNRVACWELADANKYIPFDLPQFISAPFILESLTEGYVSPVNVSIFTTADNVLKDIMRTTLTKLKRQKPINKLSAATKTHKNTHLLALTAMRGDEENFLKIAQEIPNLELWDYMLPAAKTAVFHGQTGIANIIISQYPDCLMRAEETQEYLAMVINNRQNDLIQAMVRMGAEVDEPLDNQRPLHIAVKADNLDAVKELIALGADPSLTNGDETPLFYAIRLHRIAIINYLAGLKKTSLEKPNKNGNTPLIAAVRQNSSAACEALLRHKANPDLVNSTGETAALISCTLGHADCLAALIKHGANLHLADGFGRTPIFIAVLKQSWNMAAMILLNLKTLESFNPFSYQFTVSYLRDIIRSVTERLEAFDNDDKKRFRSDVKHHRNALGLMLMKKPTTTFGIFSKPKEKQRQDYLSKIRKACEPASLANVDSRTSYVRI